MSATARMVPIEEALRAVQAAEAIAWDAVNNGLLCSYSVLDEQATYLAARDCADRLRALSASGVKEIPAGDGE